MKSELEEMNLTYDSKNYVNGSGVLQYKDSYELTKK